MYYPVFEIVQAVGTEIGQTTSTFTASLPYLTGLPSEATGDWLGKATITGELSPNLFGDLKRYGEMENITGCVAGTYEGAATIYVVVILGKHLGNHFSMIIKEFLDQKVPFARNTASQQAI